MYRHRSLAEQKEMWKKGGARQTFCPHCGKRTRMAGLCAKCQREEEHKEQIKKQGY